MNRYTRQMILPEVGAEGQARLKAAHVLVVGAGGLGCPVLQYLAGAGVGQITLVDPDHVEESNLHRQPLYRMTDLGRSKARAAHDHLAAFNPDVAVIAKCTALHPGNAVDLVASADLVIDAADSFAVSYILSDTCLDQNTPLISASVLGQSGYVGAYCGPAPSLRAVFPDLPGQSATCATAGVLGPAVGMVGTLQAQLGLQILLGTDPSPLGRMVTLDLLQLRFGGFRFSDAPEPETVWPFLALADLAATDQLLDLRPAEDAPALIHSTAQRGGENCGDLDPSRRVVLACETGLRAWRRAQELQQQGVCHLALLAARACR